jgi:endonuclease III
MTKEQEKIIEEVRKINRFETGIPEAEELLNDLEHFPHIFVLACVMDRQIKSGRAWAIPYHIGKEIGGFEFSSFLKLNLNEIRTIFVKKSLHRFNEVMAKNFYSTVQDIHSKYNNNAVNIWADKPQSALVIRRFLEFKGVGIKIANMATNILARDFKIPMVDYSSIDIAPDVQVKRFFTHYGLLRKGGSNEELIYLAREIYPKYPGILDIAAWEFGRKL